MYDLSPLVGFDQTVRGSLEAQIANIADELAYNAHDLDDGLQAGLFSPSELDEIDLWQHLRERLDWRKSYLNEIDRHHIIRELVGLQVSDVLNASAEKLKECQPQSPEDVQHYSENIVRHSDKLGQLNLELKQFLFEKMYRHFRVMRMSKRAEQFICKIYASYVDEPRQLPEMYQRRLETESLCRVVVDYIASMTDRSALLEYRRLFDPLTHP